MSYYDGRPWRALYEPGTPDDVTLEYQSLIAAFRTGVQTHPHDPLIRYFDRTMTFLEVDEFSDAFAAALRARDVSPGDRVALYLQNMPQFIISALAAWKLAAILVPLNPMLRSTELRHQLNDSGAAVLVSLGSLYEEVARAVVPETAVRLVVTTSGRDLQSRNDSRVLAEPADIDLSGTEDFVTLLQERAGPRPQPVPAAAGDTAILTYTSGTTGVPKAAMNSHGNVLANAQLTRDWMKLGPRTPILGIAPLFHITGLVCQMAASLVTGAPLILSYRFHPEVMLDSMREHAPAFAVGAVTAYVALLSADSFSRPDFASFERVYSGGRSGVAGHRRAIRSGDLPRPR